MAVDRSSRLLLLRVRQLHNVAAVRFAGRGRRDRGVLVIRTEVSRRAGMDRARLRVVEDGPEPAGEMTGEDVLREEAALMAERLIRRLPELSEDDPGRCRVVATADQLRALAASGPVPQPS